MPPESRVPRGRRLPSPERSPLTRGPSGPAVALRRLAIALAVSAVAGSLWFGLRIWMTPVRYEVVEATADGSGANRRFEEKVFASASAVGPLPLLIPVLMSGVGTWAAIRRSRPGLLVAALALGIYAFMTGFSIGAAYWPVVGLLALASAAQFLAGAPTSSLRGAV